MLQLLEVQLHASAVEVYQEKAYDLLANRAQLAVDGKRLGVQVQWGKVLLIGNGDAEAVNGTHPPGCQCGPCWKAGNGRLAAVRTGKGAAGSSHRAHQTDRQTDRQVWQAQVRIGIAKQKMWSSPQWARACGICRLQQTSPD